MFELEMREVGVEPLRGVRLTSSVPPKWSPLSSGSYAAEAPEGVPFLMRVSSPIGGVDIRKEGDCVHLLFAYGGAMKCSMTLPITIWDRVVELSHER